MSYIGQTLPADTFQGFTTDSFTGDGSATTFTLSKAPFSENGLIVVINNVIQKPTTNFTVSGTTLTIVGTAVASGDVIYATHLSGVIPSTLASKLDTNGVSDALILDADADTTISADTDDQIDIKIAGADDFQFTANTFTAQSGSTITTPTLGVGDTKDLGAALHVKVSDSGAGVDASYDTVVIEESGHSGIQILSGTSSTGLISFNDSGGTNRGYFGYSHSADRMEFATAAAERMRITSTGSVLIATTDTGAYDNTSDQAITLDSVGLGSFARASGSPGAFNRMTNDGNVIDIYGQGSQEGSIAVSGSTVSISAFTGVHWSRLADNSKPTILRGTIMESLDEMCDWYAVEFEAESTDKDIEGNSVTKKTAKRQAYALKDGESVGDTITYRYLDGNDYSAKIIKEGDVKHNKCKISDTADSKKIYGVFHRWDDADDGSDGDVNDLEVAQVGTYIIRVNKDVTVSAGDLLVSNGDGTAKKQDDDIIRSKTVAKVNSNVKVETYSDGSYTVPCTLHC